MPRWAFFQPKNLSGLGDGELVAYSGHCRKELRRIQNGNAYLEGRRDGLSKGFALDGVLVFAGVSAAGAGIFIASILTFGGALTLAGGAVALIGVHRYGDRGIERSLIADELASQREAIAFFHEEIRRIGEELTARGVPES